MADIFVSYSQKDRDVAKALADFLLECGYDLWWDYELVGGTKFRVEIKRKLESSRAAIVIWTPNSIESDWVVEEAEEAKHTKKLIATRTESLDYRQIPLGFRGVQTELVTEPERILRALQAIGVTPSRAPSKPTRTLVFDKGLDADSVAKAEQFAHWEFIKDSREPAAFTNFIALFPTSSFARLAQVQLARFAAEAWEKLTSSEDIMALSDFANDFPNDPRAAEAKQRLAVLQARAEEAASWQLVQSSTEVTDVEAHLARYPDGLHTKAARSRLKALQRDREIAQRWSELASSTEPADFETFLTDFPDCSVAGPARARLAEIWRAREETDWIAVSTTSAPAELLGFLNNHPAGVHADDALRLLSALPQKIEEQAWRLVHDTNHPVVLQGFMAAFPNGVHVKTARTKLAHLAQIKATEPKGLTHLSAAAVRISAAATPMDREAGLSIGASFNGAMRPADAATSTDPEGQSLVALAKKLTETEFVSDAVALIERLGGSVTHQTKPGFLFPRTELIVTSSDRTWRFDSEYEMAQWTLKIVVPMVLTGQQSAD